MPDRPRTLVRDASQVIVAAGAGSALAKLACSEHALPAWVAAALLGAIVAGVREIALGRPLGATALAAAGAGALAMLPASLVGEQSRTALLLFGLLPLGALVAATREFSGEGAIEMPRTLVSRPAGVGAAMYVTALFLVAVAVGKLSSALVPGVDAASLAGAATGASIMLGVMAADGERRTLAQAYEARAQPRAPSLAAGERA